jgi:hypothetical protein
MESSEQFHVREERSRVRRSGLKALPRGIQPRWALFDVLEALRRPLEQ